MLKKNSNVVEILIVDTQEIIEIDAKSNLYGPKKVSPNIYLDLDEYLFVTNFDNSYYFVQPHEINGSVIVMDLLMVI